MQVMFFDGTTRRGPMSRPTKSVKRLDNRALVSRLTDNNMNACGYYEAQAATPDEGCEITESTWAKVGDVFVQTITAQVNIADEEAIRLATPAVSDTPIETETLILQSDGVGWGYFAGPNGAIIPYLYHNCPPPRPEVLKARRDAEEAKHIAFASVAIAKGKAFKSANANANSTKQMRESLVILQEQVTAIMAMLGMVEDEPTAEEAPIVGRGNK